MGTLLPQHQLSKLENYAYPTNETYGTLDLGGASTQIAYYVPSQDIMEGLYKFQLGGQKQWNVYTKSFLQFGIDSARQRHLTALVDNFIINNLKNQRFKYKDIVKTSINPCFHSGYSEMISDSTKSLSVNVKGPEISQNNQFHLCISILKPLLEKQSNNIILCDKTTNSDCNSKANLNIYQPSSFLTSESHHRTFIGSSSSFILLKKFLQINEISTLNDWKEKGNMICKMTIDKLHSYYEMNSFAKDENHQEFQKNLPNFCFLVSYIVVLLQDGYHFPSDQKIMIIDQYNGNKVGWALGAILYEINELPWQIDDTLSKSYSWGLIILVAFIGKDNDDDNYKTV
jgi:Golgi nucleoside diphosphatase